MFLRFFGHEVIVFTGRPGKYSRTRMQLWIDGPWLEEHSCHDFMSTHQVTTVRIGKRPLEAS